MSQDQQAPHTAQNPESLERQKRHGVFSEVEASRCDWDAERHFRLTKTMNPTWQYGKGTNVPSSVGHVEIDPYGEGRSTAANYRLLISGIVPRPVGFVSTASSDGQSSNLAPYSFFQVFNHDPPVFALGINGSDAKDTLLNLEKTGECVLNIISEDFIEAANACAMKLPYGKSEWSISGLTPADSTHVKPKRVKESVFSIEAKLLSTQQLESRRDPGRKTGVIALVEGVNFWVREDAINEEKTQIDPAVLRPIARLGGISYTRVKDGFELPRPELQNEVNQGKLDEAKILPKVDGQ